MFDNFINEIGFENFVRFFKTFDICINLIIVFIICYAGFKFISLILGMCEEFKKDKDKAVKEVMNKYLYLKKEYDNLLKEKK